MTEQVTPATRAAALDRLKVFLPRAGREYGAKRNYDHGPGRDNVVSGLSPYIRHRLLSEWEVLAAVLEQHGLAASEKFIQEVFWRTYWKGWLEHRPGVWSAYLGRLRKSLDVVRADAGLRDGYEAAIEGRTGIEPFDAWVDELLATGYLHNHARMWFASIWIFSLKLPWELGADFFLRHLLDGDPASNTLSWRWVAGQHTAGKTYLATADNIEKYAGARFFADGAPAGLAKLARHAAAAVEEPVPPAVAPTLPESVPNMPRGGLLLTEEDLHLDVPVSPQTLALWTAGSVHPLPASELVRGFKRKAGEDALERAQQSWPQASVKPPLHSVADIVHWAQQHSLERIYMAYIPQGYLQMQIADLKQSLADAGCTLLMFAREYDRLAWPYARKGFFQLKKHIPDVLEALHVTQPLISKVQSIRD